MLRMTREDETGCQDETHSGSRVAGILPLLPPVIHCFTTSYPPVAGVQGVLPHSLVLPLILGAVAIMDGMLRTGMIASQAHGAVIAPLGLAVHLDVMHGTTLLAQATRDTGIRSMEGLGRHQKLTEKAAQHVGLDLRESAFVASVLVHHHPLGEFITNEVHPGSCIRFLAPQLVFAIDVKARQTDIGIGHQHRIAGMTLPALRTESGHEDIGRLACVVTTRANKIQIFGHLVHLHPTDKIQYNLGRLPSIDWKHETYPFALSRGILHRRADFVRYRQHLVIESISQPTGYPCRISYT